MMVFDLRIKDYFALSEYVLPDEPLFDEEIQGVVDRRTRQHREILPDSHPDLVGRRMGIGLQHVLRHCYPLSRRLNAMSTEDGCGILRHAKQTKSKSGLCQGCGGQIKVLLPSARSNRRPSRIAF